MRNLRETDVYPVFRSGIPGRAGHGGGGPSVEGLGGQGDGDHGGGVAVGVEAPSEVAIMTTMYCA